MSIIEQLQDEAELTYHHLTSFYKLEEFKKELRRLALEFGIPSLINKGNYSIYEGGEEFDFTEEIIEDIAECYTQEEPQSDLMNDIYGSVTSYHRFKGV